MDNVFRDANTIHGGEEVISATSLRPMSACDASLPERLLEKQKGYINRTLKARKLAPATVIYINVLYIGFVIEASET